MFERLATPMVGVRGLLAVGARAGRPCQLRWSDGADRHDRGTPPSSTSKRSSFSGRSGATDPLLLAEGKWGTDFRVDTFPRGPYSPAAQIHRAQFRPGPTDVGMGDGAW